MLAFLIASALAAELPDWTKGHTLERNSNILRVVCTGTAVSLDLAREQANSSCQSEAIRQVQTKVAVRSESVETEHDSVLHQEVRSNETYTGLSCHPERESVTEGPDTTTVYLQCSYDLSKARSVASQEPQPTVSLIRHTDTVSEDVPEVSGVKEEGYKQAASRHILVSTVPGLCDTVIINGRKPARVVRCTENPQLVTVDSLNDKELVIRPKTKGLMPKTVSLDQMPASLEIQYEDQ